MRDRMTFSEIMEFNAPYNQRNIDELINKIKANTVVPYVGAGMSVLFDNIYPSWTKFLYDSFDEFADVKEKNKFEKLNHEEKADFLYKEIGVRTFSTYLKEIFGPAHLEKDASCFNNKPAFLLPVIFNKGLLMTTNYDKVIEKNYALFQKAVPVAHPGHFEALNGALRNEELLLYKIHGDISEPIESIILTKEQYEKAYGNQSLKEALTKIYISKNILFLGCALCKDRPIQFLLEVSQSGMDNFAIVSCAGEQVKQRRLELENEYYTKAIIYPEAQHECLFEILKYIAQAVNPEEYNAMNGYLQTENNLELDDEWFIKQNEIQIKNLGDRYLPELNVEPSVSKVFDGLSRNDSFHERLKKQTDNLLICLNELKMSVIEENVLQLANVIEGFLINTNDSIDVDNINENLNVVYNEIEKKIKEMIRQEEKNVNGNNAIDYQIYSLRRAQNEIYNYEEYISSKEIQAANIPFILLHGDGGIGKSHLIADIITQRNKQNKHSLLFLGQHFKIDNPITEILKALEIPCKSEIFLETLNKKGEEEKSRIILFIDALNEGNGKKIWNEYLAGFVELLKRFPWIGLVVSIRTEYLDKLFEDKDSLKSEFVLAKHSGFSMIEHKALRKYFEHYGITCCDIPFTEHEFRNPLFVRLFCEGFKNRFIDWGEINFNDIYANYLNSINKKIAENCRYSRRINIVKEVIHALVLYKHNQNSRNNVILLADAIEVIIDIEKKYNVQNPLLDELIANGVLTQNIGYDNQEYIYITYEKLDDYLYAKALVDELYSIKVDAFKKKYADIIHYTDILEAIAIVLSEKDEYELFEIFPESSINNIADAFCRALKWRKTKKFKPSVMDYINNVVMKTRTGFQTLFEELILLSAKIEHDLNAEWTVEYILKHNMPDRDAMFIPIFDELFFKDDSVIQRLLDWCLFDAKREKILDQTIELTSIMLATFLISPNNWLRDKTTKALIKLLEGKIDILISVLNRYSDIDDPYIIERLYAVSFGCVVSEQDDLHIEKLAMYVYNKIFKAENVYPNILLRDYAKNIIDYAKYKVKSKKLLSLDVQPPYNTNFPEVPTDEEISEYEYDYKAPDFKEYYWSQNAILRSMKVEYSRNGDSGWYGDFGRYVFQRYFSGWRELDPNDLRNIAIKKIFDMGYDVEKHGIYDRAVSKYNERMSSQKCERIGKKYQWIALFELAAQVTDNYQLEVHTDDQGNKKKIYCLGAFEPSIRNIDPTVSIEKGRLDENNEKLIHDQIYTIPNQDHISWLANFDDLPNIKEMIQHKYQQQDYLLLNGWYTWTEEKPLGMKKYQVPQKDVWVFINSYIVKKEQLAAYIKLLSGADLMGRWAAEPHDNYQLFNKEYYWSEGYHFFKNPYYCGEEWVDFDYRYGYSTQSLGPVLLPTFHYLSERPSDTNDESSISWYKPCGEIFDFLQLRYGKENTALYDKKGDLICFDSNEILREEIGFFIKEKALQSFLEENGYTMFWTILAEKRILQDPFAKHERNYPMPHISGVALRDSNKEFSFEYKQIIE